MRLLVVISVLVLSAGGVCAADDALKVDESPAGTGEWGFRPAEDSACALTPPAFVWRPQKPAVAYELQVSRDKLFKKVDYSVNGLALFCHCPPKALAPGQWCWRFRFTTKDGRVSQWSSVRAFAIPEDATQFPMPTRDDLLGRIPGRHPKLYVRPEDLPELRRLADGKLKPIYDGMVARCERIMKKPPDMTEPLLYPEGTDYRGEEWRKMWWGNRVRTVAVLDGAATLGFAWLIGGNEQYAEMGRKLLLAAAAWDPHGATGYRYNDEAGMPGAYHMARAYTFLYPVLTEEERAAVRKSLTARGKEMYAHLHPRHIWCPYSSHPNRAWHFLGEVGIALHGEVAEAEDWVWFAANVFWHSYPVWCDDDGGWHEGLAYWRSYISRFTWWGEVMRNAFGVDVYKKPYFSQVGYYPLYLQPPGSKGGGFGDLAWYLNAGGNVRLMSIFAAHARNPYWQWYVDVHGGAGAGSDYISFVRGMLPKVEAKPPVDLPTSRLFRGVGLALLNTNIVDAKKNIQVHFKSSPFGTQSHGFEAQNSFLLYAFGERLLIRTGRRDMYGSKHHRDWMWHTKSTNSITVDGEGQLRRNTAAKGEIVGFHTSERFDYVAGEAAKAYAGKLDKFTRHVLFIKPQLIVIYDELAAPKPVVFDWRLHAVEQMEIKSQADVMARNGPAAARVAILHPTQLQVSQTDKFDPPPRPRVKLVQYHLTASTPAKLQECRFVTAIQPYHAESKAPEPVRFEQTASAFVVRARCGDEQLAVVLARAEGVEPAVGGREIDADIAVLNADGRTLFRVKDGSAGPAQ